MEECKDLITTKNDEIATLVRNYEVDKKQWSDVFAVEKEGRHEDQRTFEKAIEVLESEIDTRVAKKVGDVQTHLARTIADLQDVAQR